MSRLLQVQTVKVHAIHSQQNAFVAGCIGEHFIVRPALVGTANLGDGKHVMPECAESNNDWLWKVFIG